MKKLLSLLLVISMLGSTLSGCTNIKDDGTRTKTEGALAGALAGAAAGAAAGAVADGKRGALIGAVIGLVVGAAGGFAYGSHVASKKAEYATEEEWLNACIKSAEESNKAIREYNQKMVAEMRVLDRQSAKLMKDYEAKTANRSTLTAEKKNIDEKIKQTSEWIAAADLEITEQSKVLEEVKTAGKSEYATALESEIILLRKQKAQLEGSNRQLTAMSSRLSV